MRRYSLKRRHNDLLGGQASTYAKYIPYLIKPIKKVIGFVESAITKLFTAIQIALQYKKFGMDEKEYFSTAKLIGSSKPKIIQILSKIKDALVKGKASVLIYLLKSLKSVLSQLPSAFELLNSATGGNHKPDKLTYFAWMIVKKIDFAIRLIEVEVSRKLHPKEYSETITIDHGINRRHLARRRDSVYGQLGMFFKNIKILFMHAKNGFISDSLIGLSTLALQALQSLKVFVSNIWQSLLQFIDNYEFLKKPPKDGFDDPKDTARYLRQNHINESVKIDLLNHLRKLKSAIITGEEAKNLVTKIKEAASNIKIKELFSKLLLKIGQQLSKLKMIFNVVKRASKASDTISMCTALAPLRSMAM